MSDVSTWSPTDEANTAVPPDGWPEFMMPAMVNNTGRMMMGAIKRMYDQQVSGAIVLPYLKLVGGQTVTGAVTFAAGITASAITSNSTIYAAGSIVAGGTISASGQISSLTSVTTSGNMVAGGSINCAEYICGGARAVLNNSGHMYYHDAVANPCLVMTSGHDNAYANTRHLFNDRSNTVNWAIIGGSGLDVVSALTVGTTATIGGGLTVGTTATIGGGLTVSANGILVSNGNISANGGGWYYSNGLQFGNNAGRFYANGEIVANNAIWAENTPGHFGLAGDGTDYMLKFRSDCFLRFQRSSANLWWQLGPTIGVWAINADGFCHADANAVGGNGAYVNFSDEGLKTDIEPATQGLDIILGLQPMRFRRLPREGMPPPRLEVGFIAQQVQATFPEAVVEVQRVADPDPVLGLDDGAIVAALVGAVKTLEARLTAGGL